MRRRETMRSVPPLLALLLAATFAGCALLPSRRPPVVPRPNQAQWLDEPVVISLVTRYVYESHFDSRRDRVERQYAARLQQWYAFASAGGKDVDGGQRAVNFVHKIHRDAKGSKELWKRVLSLAQEPSTAGQDGPALPPEVK
jgi:hypothetical protein